MIGKILKLKMRIVILSLFISNSLFAADIAVDAKVNKTTVALNENLSYTLTIMGSSKDGNFNKDIFKHFSILSQSSSQSFSYVNGDFNRLYQKPTF